MPSIISSLTTLLAASAVVVASPFSLVTRATFDQLSLPESELPAPKGELKYVTVGTGTQNYTCGDDASEAPIATGAIAELYDIGGPLERILKARQGQRSDEKFDRVKRAVLLNISGVLLKITDGSGVLPFNPAPVIGQHFFSSNPTAPVFDLTAVDAKAVVALESKVPAPQESFEGKSGEGAVDWLYLVDNGSSFGGVSEVYRIATAGGSAPETCEGLSGEFTVEYAAQYWFFG